MVRAGDESSLPLSIAAGQRPVANGSLPTRDRVTAVVAPHCPACQVVADLAEHRDATAADWSARRGALNFAIVLARRACPAYARTSTTETTPETGTETAR